MRIILWDRKQSMCDAWKAAAQQTDIGSVTIEIRCGRITLEQQGNTSYVSPANSFGFMDGGIDAWYASLDPDVERYVRDTILHSHNGELPVGSSFCLGFSFGGLIVAPTMRTPMILPKDSVNVYLAMRAACIEWNPFGPFASVNEELVVPGMGTGVGQMDPEISARQMFAAINRVFGTYTPVSRWSASNVEHQMLYKGKKEDCFVNLQDPSKNIRSDILEL